MNKPKLRNIALAALVCLLLLGLAGCFDYEIELALKKDGSGSLSAVLSAPDTASPPSGKLLDLILPKPTRTQRHSGQRMLTKDSSNFDFIDAVALKGLSISIKETSFGVLGLTAHTYRITAKLYPKEGDRPDRRILPGREREPRPPDPEPSDPAQRLSRAYVSKGLKGNFLGVTFRVPGKVKEALPLTLGSSLITPRLSKDQSRVSWRIPWSVLINEQVNHTLVFTADFKGDLEFRVPGQTLIHTHLPFAQEEAQAAEQGKPKGGKTKPGGDK